MEIEKEVLFLSNVASLTSVDNLLLLEENIGSVRIEYRALSLGMLQEKKKIKYTFLLGLGDENENTYTASRVYECP